MPDHLIVLQMLRIKTSNFWRFINYTVSREFQTRNLQPIIFCWKFFSLTYLIFTINLL